MALIHQHLYGSVSLARIALIIYATNLAEALRMTLSPQTRLNFDLDDERVVELAVERAVPVCLTLNELLTNALKYGGVGAKRTKEALEAARWS